MVRRVTKYSVIFVAIVFVVIEAVPYGLTASNPTVVA